MNIEIHINNYTHEQFLIRSLIPFDKSSVRYILQITEICSMLVTHSIQIIID